MSNLIKSPLSDLVRSPVITPVSSHKDSLAAESESLLYTRNFTAGYLDYKGNKDWGWFQTSNAYTNDMGTIDQPPGPTPHQSVLPDYTSMTDGLVDARITQIMQTNQGYAEANHGTDRRVCMGIRRDNQADESIKVNGFTKIIIYNTTTGQDRTYLKSDVTNEVNTTQGANPYYLSIYWEWPVVTDDFINDTDTFYVEIWG